MAGATTDHVQVQLSIDSVGLARLSFGVPLILSHKRIEDSFSDRVRYYSRLAAVAEDFETDDVEYLAARQMFSQGIRRIAIGRAAGSVTQRYDVDILDVLDSHAYEIRVAGEGFEEETVTVTSDTDATADEIVADFVTALNAVADRNYTASAEVDASGADTLRITGNAANDWFSVEVMDVERMSIVQSHAAPSDVSLEEDLNDILRADAGWYCLVTLYNSTAYSLDAAEWTEPNGRIYIFDDVDTNAIATVVSGATDAIGQMFELAYTRTMGAYHHAPDEFLAAAIAARFLKLDPGKITAKFKTLVGVTPSQLTDTHKTNLRNRRGNAYEQVRADRAFFWEGTVFSTVYRFIDVTRNADWLEDGANAELLGVLVANEIVPHTPEGRALLEGALRGFIRGEAVDQGVLSGSPLPEVEADDEVSDEDKANRNYGGLKFDGTFAGAIHTVIPVTGVLTF